jgi:hypothetical protein
MGVARAAASCELLLLGAARAAGPIKKLLYYHQRRGTELCWRVVEFLSFGVEPGGDEWEDRLRLWLPSTGVTQDQQSRDESHHRRQRPERQITFRC